MMKDESFNEVSSDDCMKVNDEKSNDEMKQNKILDLMMTK